MENLSTGTVTYSVACVSVAPTLSSLSPSTGPAGTTVTLTGTGFYGATAVNFGTRAATSFTVNSATSITAVAPAGTGTVAVKVTTDGGTSTATSVTYTLEPEHITVTTGVDDITGNATNCPGAACSLRDALAAANADGGAEITFDPAVFAAASTISLNSELVLASNVSIDGPGANVLSISSGLNSTVFQVNAGVTASIDALTVNRGGQASGSAAITNQGTLTVSDCTFSANSGYDGGGIYNQGTLTASNCTFAGNSANTGGGIYNKGTLTVSNSTFSGNSAAAGVGMEIYGTATVTNSTFGANAAGGNPGGVINVEGSGTLTIADNIFTGGTIANGAITGGVNDLGGTVTDNGHNVFYNNAGGDSAGFTLAASDITGRDTKLASVGAYGGATETMPPLPGSAALSAGTYQSGEPTTDQRGAPRPSTNGTAIDAGSVQISNEPPLVTSIQPNQGPIGGGTSVTISGTGLDSPTAVSFGGVAATSYQVNAASTSSPASITAVSAAHAAGTVDVTVSNSSGTSATSSIDQFAYHVPVVIDPAAETLDPAYGTYFSQTFTASGGSGAYTLTNGGTLPAGLTLTPASGSAGSTWTLSGTPAAVGSQTIQLTAQDQGDSGNSTTQSYTLNVATATPAASVTTATPILIAYGQGDTVGVLLAPQSPGSGIAAPSGVVTYSIDGGAQQTATLSAGQANLSIPSTVAAGSHQITWSYAGDGNYGPLSTQNIAFTVAKATLTVTASSGAMTYGGSVPAITPSYSGFLNGDTATSLTTPPACTTTATAMSAVGSYASSCSGAVDGNYTIQYVQGAVTVNRASLTMTAANATRVYGAANPVFTGTVTGAVNGDTFTESFATAATAAAPPGTYSIVPTLTGANLANYTVTTNNGTLTVTKATLMASAANTTRVYGAANPVFTGTVTGAVNGDTFTESFATAATAASPAGTYSIVPTVAGANLADYTVSTTDGTLTVAKATLMASAANTTRVYGASNPVFTGTVTGAVNGDTFTESFATAATAASPVGTYSIVPTVMGANLANYTVTTTDGTLTVTKATLMASAANATRAYGAANPAFTGTVMGAVNGDTFTESFATAATAASPAGTYSIVPTLMGANLANYMVTTTDGTLTVTKATLMASAANATRVYGAANPVFTGTVTGAVNGDTFTESFATAAAAASPAGTYSIVPTVMGANLANYMVATTDGTLTVTKATLMASAANATRAYGAANPAFTGTVVGAVNGDTFTESFATAATAASPVGTYSIVPTVMGANLANYTVTTTDGTLTVTKATLMASAANAARAYGAANPVFTGTVTGAVDGDTFTESFATTATQSSNVGTYSIAPSVTGMDLSDYALTEEDGTLTVVQAGTSTTLSASATSATPGQSLTLTAQVIDASAGSTGTPDGTVSFYDGTTLLGTGTLTQGNASYTASGLTSGVTHVFSASYGGSINFSGSSSQAAVSVPVAALSFSLVVNGVQGQTVQPGGMASYSFQVSPTYGSYPSAVTFSASGLPPGATVTFSPSTITATGGTQLVTVSIQTAGPGTSARGNNPFARGLPVAMAFLLFPLLGVRRMRRRLRGAMFVLLLAAGVAGTASLSGCGTANGFNWQAVKNYTITVTATSGGVQHSFDVNLNVQ